MAKLNGTKVNNASLPDIRQIIQAGIDLATKYPSKMVNGEEDDSLRNETVDLISVIDRQDYVNRGKWYNLPKGIDSQELERMMYYKGQLAFFYIPEKDQFYFMPFALDGGLDFYGRYTGIHPVPFSNGTDQDTKEEKQALEVLRNYLSTLKLTCVYDVVDDEEIVENELFEKGAVILRDYTPNIGQTVVPRVTLQKPFIEREADFFCYTRTAGLIALGIKGMRVNDADQAGEAKNAADKYKSAALRGIPWLAMTGTQEFQDLATATGVKSDEFLMILQSIDNLRLRALGINNGGLFQKRAQELKDQAAINGGPIEMEAQDWITRRQHFCNVINSIWNCGTWYEPSEILTGSDRDQNGAIYDDEASDTTIESTEVTENDSNN